MEKPTQDSIYHQEQYNYPPQPLYPPPPKSSSQMPLPLQPGIKKETEASLLTNNGTAPPHIPSQPMPPHPDSLPRFYELPASDLSGYKPLNVKDALSYLDLVKQRFSDQPEVYNRFLDIMKEISTPGVIDRVSTLFRGHPQLIMGFNTFLPPGYRIESTNNPDDPICVITPHDQPPYYPSNFQPVLPPVSNMPGFNYIQEGQPMPGHSLPPIASLQAPTLPVAMVTAEVKEAEKVATTKQVFTQFADHRAPVEFNHAINYVNKIKNRFASEPEIYKQFLEILQTYQKEQKPIQEVYSQVQLLFNGAQDLLEEFKQFLPDTSSGRLGAYPRAAVASKRAKRPPPGAAQVPGFSQRKRARTAPFKPVPNAALDKTGTLEELEFFDKCKRIIGNKTTYNEFLKILNLFSQEIIDSKVLVERIEPFLSKSPELFDWFKKFVRYEDDDIIYNVPVEQPEVDLRTCKKSGHSYRLLPAHLPRPVCSGRDDFTKEFLNDDWISHPVYVSETGFVSHKKTQYEEAMYKCEEERYEFDLNIEANLHTIALLEPWAKKIEDMSNEEKAQFKLPRDLGGFSTSIFQRVIKKIYDRERGLEVIEAIFTNPAIAIPVVIKRLKQKDEEWKRSQREWNKVWREIDSKNFAKSLDHQGIHFKTSDRKSMNSKSLLTEIETLYREQKERHQRRSGVTALPTNRYQFDFAFKDIETFGDCKKILLTFMDSSMTLSPTDEASLKEFIQTFLPKFFLVSMDGQSPVDYKAKYERNSLTFYANTHFYVFFRLFQMLYARLLKMKEMSDELAHKPPVAVHLNPVAVELGLQKEMPSLLTEKDRYTELIKNSLQFLSGEMDPTDYEDKARGMYGTSAYLVFTLDKLVQTMTRQMHIIITDAKSLDLMNLFRKDCEKRTTSSRQEAVYRLSAESLMQDESMLRIEFLLAERVLTIQLLGKEDAMTDDSLTAEEKWTFYVDQFVQLSTHEKLVGKNRIPFLRRNLPNSVGREPPQNVVTRSGLELKICMNTYKIFFVDNTEDFFYRRWASDPIKKDAFQHAEQKAKKLRHTQFREWLEGPDGWKKNLEVSAQSQNQFEDWIKEKTQVLNTKDIGQEYRRFKLIK